MGAQDVRALHLPTSGACAETLDVLQSLASHLPMTLLHVRGLLLGDGAENRVPKALHDPGDVQGDGCGLKPVVRPDGGIDSETRPPSYGGGGGHGFREQEASREHGGGHGGGKKS